MVISRIKTEIKKMLPATSVLRVESFRRATDINYIDASTPFENRPLCSEVVRAERLISPEFESILSDLGQPKTMHRKNWELAFVASALLERGLLTSGKRGLAFAVGQERLPSLFAERGCEIVATDLSAEDERNTRWKASNQWSGAVDDLIYVDVCEPTKALDKIAFEPVDMNHIPHDLRGFDFTWSTCSFEHCGSIELGKQFILNQMACLKPGGVAVHTTEFNLSSENETITDGPTVIFRLKDIEDIIRSLQNEGHHVAPLDVRLGIQAENFHIDKKTITSRQYNGKKHLRLWIKGYATTSIALIITKAGGSCGLPTPKTEE